MGNSFVKLKTKYILSAVLKSVIVGIACGLLAVGAVMLPLKLCKIIIHFAYYILIGAGTAGLSGALLFCLFYKFGLSDKKIAKKIDKDYALNERVQTTVAYGEEQGDIVTLLREDTELRLGNLPKRKFDFVRLLKAVWYYAVVCVLSLALFISALCIPVHIEEEEIKPPIKVEPDPDVDPDNPPFEYTAAIKSALYDLINDVLTSKLQEAEMTAFYDVLHNLDSVLLTLTKQKEVELAVETAVLSLKNIVENANSFNKISSCIKDCDENLSTAIEQGVILYQTFSAYKSLAGLNNVNFLYGRVDDKINDVLEGFFNSSFEDHRFTDKNSASPVDELIEGLNGAIKQSGVEEGDALYTAIVTFTKSMKSVCDTKVGFNYSLEDMNSGETTSLAQAYKTFKADAIKATLPQTYNCIMYVYVQRQLDRIFGSASSGIGTIYEGLKPIEGLGPDIGGPIITPDNPGGGGYAPGNDEYAGTDLVYDEVTGEMVKYGTLYERYKATIEERYGDLPQELIDFIEEYFSALRGKGNSSEKE